LYLRGGAGRTGDPVLTSEVLHAMLSLKLWDHEGLALFIHGPLLKRMLLLVLPAILSQILICASRTPAPVYCRVQSGTAWCCPAAAGRTPAPGTQPWETQCWFCVFCFISLNIISIINVISKTGFIFNL